MRPDRVRVMIRGILYYACAACGYFCPAETGFYKAPFKSGRQSYCKECVKKRADHARREERREALGLL